MNGQLSRGTQRLVALVLLFLVIFAVFTAVFPVWSMYARDRDAIPEYEEQIARFNRIAEKRAALEATALRLETAREQTTSLLPERTATLAAAALQERVKRVVTRAGGRLISTQVLPVSTDEPFSQIGVGIRISTSIDSLRGVLHSLESEEPHVTVDNLTVLARQRRSKDRKPVAESELDVRFNLYGLMVEGPESAVAQ